MHEVLKLKENPYLNLRYTPHILQIQLSIIRTDYSSTIDKF